jgi:RNA polymerase sigma-70 factor, ECF subfamily
MSLSAARPFLPTFGKSPKPSAGNRHAAADEVESKQHPEHLTSSGMPVLARAWASEAVSDEELISLICGGDKDALGLLFRRYARVVRGVAYRVLRDASEADDLLQDIFLLIHRLCRTFDSSRGSARHWILQMTHRRAISRRRYLTSRHFYNRLDLDETAGWLQNPMTRTQRHADSIGEALEKKETLQSWFEQLSPNQRETLRLFFFEGHNFEEIAARLGQTTVNARQYYYRGLDRLRKRIFAGKLPKGEALW